jgi:isoleucyl-tRNA synthetase
VRLLAPILAHTAEEAWAAMKYKSQECESVHLALMPESNIGIANRALSNENSWEAIMALRTHVLGKLEDLRKEDVIGSNQEASVKIVTDSEEWLDIDTEMFTSLCIVSEVSIEKGESLVITADKCKHNKCERCWNYWPSVGSDSQYSDLCGRCVEVVKGL